MNWHHPDLYLFLCVLAGLAALLAIAYKVVSRRRKPASMPDSRQAGELARRAALLRRFRNVPARDRRNDDEDASELRA
jgi:hypothetical protein